MPETEEQYRVAWYSLTTEATGRGRWNANLELVKFWVKHGNLTNPELVHWVESSEAEELFCNRAPLGCVSLRVGPCIKQDIVSLLIWEDDGGKVNDEREKK
jgi:hypothetical protein